MTEYLIIVALIAIAAIGVYSFFGQSAVRQPPAGVAQDAPGKAAAKSAPGQTRDPGKAVAKEAAAPAPVPPVQVPPAPPAQPEGTTAAAAAGATGAAPDK